MSLISPQTLVEVLLAPISLVLDADIQVICMVIPLSKQAKRLVCLSNYISIIGKGTYYIGCFNNSFEVINVIIDTFLCYNKLVDEPL